MRHAHRLLEALVKQDGDLAGLAQQYLSKQAVAPSPAWYARLLEEHRLEIGAVVALWLSDLENHLAVMDWVEWTDALLWMEFEARLARRLSPALANAAQAAARRQAVEEGEPVPVRLADTEASLWAETEAARQARLIANETRLAMLEAFEVLDATGLSVEDRRRAILEGGLFALNRRFARAALRPLAQEGAQGLMGVMEAGQRLLAVRREMIESHNAVSGVTEGILIAALFWQREGKLVTKTWVTIPDELRCPICASMHFQEVPLRGAFVAADGQTFARPPAHPGCRCFTRIVVRPVDAFELVA